MRPIRVLHIRDTDRLCGPGKTILENVRADRNGDVSYYVASFRGPADQRNSFLEQLRPYCPVLEIPTLSRLDFRSVLSLHSFIHQNKIDVIHSHEYKSDILGLLVAKLNNIPIVTTVHGWFTNNVRSRIYVTIDRFLLRFFNVVVAVSQNMHAEFLRLGIKRERLWLIPNAVVVKNYFLNTSHPSLREELNLAPTNILIGNVGRLSPEKGQKDFIEAANLIAPRYPEARFVLIGDGPDQLFLRDYVEISRLRDTVFFTGYRNDMANIYKSLNLLILSSKTEGLPNVVLEAMAAKIPVIATNVGGTGELITDRETGLLISPGSIQALAEAIEYAISSRSAMERMAAVAYEQVRKKFNFEKNVDRTIELYESLIQRKKEAKLENRKTNQEQEV